MKLPVEWFILSELVEVGIAELLTQREADACRFRARKGERPQPKQTPHAERVIAADRLAELRKRLEEQYVRGVVWERDVTPLVGHVGARAS